MECFDCFTENQKCTPFVALSGTAYIISPKWIAIFYAFQKTANKVVAENQWNILELAGSPKLLLNPIST